MAVFELEWGSFHSLPRWAGGEQWLTPSEVSILHAHWRFWVGIAWHQVQGSLVWQLGGSIGVTTANDAHEGTHFDRSVAPLLSPF